jgi:hypothetical protein
MDLSSIILRAVKEKTPKVRRPRRDYYMMGGRRVYCLTAAGVVTMADDTCKSVAEIQIGDRVRTILKMGEEEKDRMSFASTVEEEVMSRRFASTDAPPPFAPSAVVVAVTLDEVHEVMPMARVHDTWLTAGHPVRVRRSEFIAGGGGESSCNGEMLNCALSWHRPSDLVEPVPLFVDYLYNFVLDTRSSVLVNGLEVSTLGQFCEGIDNEDSFFGSERVVETVLSPQNRCRWRINARNIYRIIYLVVLLFIWS